MATKNEGKFVVAKVNVAEHMQVAAKHSVTGVPTIVIFKGGEEVGRRLGFASLDEMQAMLDNA